MFDSKYVVHYPCFLRKLLCPKFFVFAQIHSFLLADQIKYNGRAEQTVFYEFNKNHVVRDAPALRFLIGSTMSK
jgi:hypothetical protein